MIDTISTGWLALYIVGRDGSWLMAHGSWLVAHGAAVAATSNEPAPASLLLPPVI
jgi:hypothetical protein